MDRTLPPRTSAEKLPEQAPEQPKTEDQPFPEQAARKITKAELQQLVQACTNELAQAVASDIVDVYKGNVDPIPIAAQQRVEMIRLNCLINTLIEAAIIEDEKLAMMIVNGMRAAAAEINRPKIARAVKVATPVNGNR